MDAGLADWYRGRRVFVTGHTGFKGAWLTAWLRDAGAAVTGYALPPASDRPNLFDAARVGDTVASTFADIRDRRSLERAIAAARPEIVFHLAAQSLVRRSYAEPVDTLSTNVIGTANVLDCVRRVPDVGAVVVVTSDKCYESQALDRGYVETDPVGGHDPYSASKGCAELVTATFRRSFFADDGPAVASARAGNVIGGGDWAEDRLIPDLVRARANGTRVRVRRPDAVRPWQFVLEPLRGYLMLGRALATEGRAVAEGWNFGPRDDDAVSVAALVERVTRRFGDVADVRPDPLAPHETATLRLDHTKARERLGWDPVLDLDASLALTLDWYLAYDDDPRSAAPMMTSQLHAYAQRTIDTAVTA